MVKAFIRTALLVAIILVLAQFVPIVAQYQVALIVAAVAIGIVGFIMRALLIALVVGALFAFLHWYGIY